MGFYLQIGSWQPGYRTCLVGRLGLGIQDWAILVVVVLCFVWKGIWLRPPRPVGCPAASSMGAILLLQDSLQSQSPILLKSCCCFVWKGIWKRAPWAACCTTLLSILYNPLKQCSLLQLLCLDMNLVATTSASPVLVSCPTRWSLYWPLALCVDHLSILLTERQGTAMYYKNPYIFFLTRAWLIYQVIYRYTP